MNLSHEGRTWIHRLPIAAVKRGRSSARARCSVPRMSHVLTSVFSFHSAWRTSSMLQSTRAAIWSSAADMSWAWAPPISPTTSASCFFGARRVRRWRWSRKGWTCGQLSWAAFASVEELGTARDELVPPGAGADKLNGRADELAHPLDVVAAALGQVVPAFGCADRLLPSLQVLVDGCAVLVVGDIGDWVVVFLASKLVSGADLEQRLVVEDIQAHQGRDADAVEAHGVARDGGVEPADASRPSGDGAELVAALPYLVPHLVEKLGGKRAVADA